MIKCQRLLGTIAWVTKTNISSNNKKFIELATMTADTQVLFSTKTQDILHLTVLSEKSYNYFIFLGE